MITASSRDALAALTRSRLLGLASELRIDLPVDAAKDDLVEILARRIVDRRQRSQLAEPLTLSQLESHLWESANIMRGKIDSADFRHYIFGLLFYKRLCDVWEEEYEERLLRYGDPVRAADPAEHRFHLPVDATWDKVRRQEAHLGRHLTAAFRLIEEANPPLQGVFQDVDFDNPHRFPDATIDLLLSHFEKHRLRNADVEADMLGNAYEYLIAQFAGAAAKKGGEFYTPKQVVRLIVECLEPRAGMSLYDPACGSGGMLLGAVHHLRQRGEDPATLGLYAQEMNLNTWAICQMNLFLHNVDHAHVVCGDTLRDPKHLRPGGRRLRLFDRVLANPPYSLKNWGHETWRDDRFSRDRYGCPPPTKGDMAFLQHMVASLKADGMLGVVVPHGNLYRGGAEGEIRRRMIEDDLVEAVIGLAPNVFYGSSISAAVLVLRRRKPENRRGWVLFVDGSGEARSSGKNQNFLEDRHVERLAKAFHDFAEEEGFARVVELDEIRHNEHSLYLSRYVAEQLVEHRADAETEARRLVNYKAEWDVAHAEMIRNLRDLGFDV